jgi:predicted molibdopterin-dependent oxidoreductase YjgC
MTNSIREIRQADCILITGSNTAESHPVISYEVIRAVKRGATLILIDPRRVPLARHATLFLQAQPGTDIYVFLAMAHVILREGLADTEFLEQRVEGFEAFRSSVTGHTPEAAALVSGVPAEQIERAARLYATGGRAFGESAFGEARGHSTILYAMGITQRSIGTQLVQMLANLAMLTGQVGKPSSGVNPLRGQSNVQGACDVGGLPEYLPGYQRVEDEVKRRQVAQTWGLDELPARAGLTVVEMMHAAADGKVRAMYVMGENPLMSDPDLQHVEKALRRLDFLVVQDIFFNETAQLAHVILPAAAALEKDGTMTNTERRVQLLRPVVQPPGEARPDWSILAEIGTRLDRRRGLEREVEFWEFGSTADVMDEIAAVAPIYRGVRHHRLRQAGLTWPVPDARHPGTPILHVGTFSRGKGQMLPVTAQMPAEQPDAEYPMILSTGRTLYHYHSGTMTRRSEGLAWREPRSYAEINEEDAARLGVRDAGPIVLLSRRGQVRTQARVGQRVPAGTVFLSFHWREAPANLLTHDFALDAQAKIPEYKVCAVRVEVPKRGRG